MPTVETADLDPRGALAVFWWPLAGKHLSAGCRTGPAVLRSGDPVRTSFSLLDIPIVTTTHDWRIP